MAAGIVLLLCPVFSPAFYVFYIVAGVSDMLDGFVARKTDTVSKLGARLDTMADFVDLSANTSLCGAKHHFAKQNITLRGAQHITLRSNASRRRKLPI